MNIEQSKEKLKKDGYTYFEIAELNPKFYTWLLNLKCNNESNFKSKLTQFRADLNYEGGKRKENLNIDYNEFNKAFEKKKELLKLLKNDAPNVVGSQMWHFADLNNLFSKMELEMGDYQSYIKDIMTYFFDCEDNQEYAYMSFATYYDEGCFLNNHSDGTGTGRICALLIYLNETYDENDGGSLILNNSEKVTPTFGRCAIIDLQSFDIQHMVTEVTGGIGRYAILSFVRKKENEFINY
jgi:Rps23 Pro-64 3,4-dihydroxylase Tpa1-like proline 4-hydroxylase